MATMINIRSATSVIVLLLSSIASGQPQTFLLNPVTLTAIAESLRSGDPEYTEAAKKLFRDADKSLKISPVSVIEKTSSPPSGDKHDYMSMARYWWPDPSKPDGLPYIHKDGVGNPEAAKFTDRRNLVVMVDNVSKLALAYYFSGNSDYADHAATMIRTWFLNPETRMNPNMKFSQLVPGRSKVRGGGILGAREFVQVIDAIGLLAGSNEWTSDDQTQMRAWFSQYYTWLMQSEHGKLERNAKNNHGTLYDVQSVSIALFLGKTEEAAKIVDQAKTKRIKLQIEPDGSQPNELVRTRSWDYSVFNLNALFQLASLANRVNVDLWDYSTSDGRSVRKALDYLVPYLKDGKSWPYQSLDGIQEKDLYPILLQAMSVYHDSEYYSLARDISGIDQRRNVFILYYGKPKFDSS